MDHRPWTIDYRPSTMYSPLLMYLAAKMKLYIRIVCDLCIQEPFTLCQINRMTILIFCTVHLFKAKEIIQRLLHDILY